MDLDTPIRIRPVVADGDAPIIDIEDGGRDLSGELVTVGLPSAVLPGLMAPRSRTGFLRAVEGEPGAYRFEDLRRS